MKKGVSSIRFQTTHVSPLPGRLVFLDLVKVVALFTKIFRLDHAGRQEAPQEGKGSPPLVRTAAQAGPLLSLAERIELGDVVRPLLVHALLPGSRSAGKADMRGQAPQVPAG
jgi:hypothetical protein